MTLRLPAQAQVLQLPAAIAAEEDAVQQTQEAAKRWQAPATLHAADGQSDRAAQARQRAHTLANTIL